MYKILDRVILFVQYVLLHLWYYADDFGTMRSNFGWRKIPNVKTCRVGKTCTEIIDTTEKVSQKLSSHN